MRFSRCAPWRAATLHQPRSCTARQQRSLGTFSRQSELPRLPIVPLEETAARYLRTCHPVLTPKEFATTQAVVADFIRPGGEGEKLQRRLVEYDRTQPHSWLESIWLDKAYLSWRESTLINVNWWLEFRDTPEIQAAASAAENAPARGEYTEVQLKRASGMITNLLNFKDALDSGSLPVETMGKKQTPLCMNQYRMQFGVCRVPKKPADQIVQSFPATAQHIIVMLDDQIYRTPVVGPNGERVSVQQLHEQLQKVVQHHKQSDESSCQPAVGLLTSEHRDKWADMRHHMISLDKQNEQSFRTVEDSLFAVCLDDYHTAANVDLSHRVIFHGHNARNRWFDKSLAFIYTNNGRGGCSGEHSPSDAVIPGRIIGDCVKAEPAVDPPGARKDLQLAEPEKIVWRVDKTVLDAIDAAETRAEKEIADVDSVLLHFNQFGGDDIKRGAKCSPDAFLQMAMQLTWHRIYKEPCPTYESASVRQFLHGRTETIRSCSDETVAFTAAFDDAKVADSEKFRLFQEAVQQHVKYSINATNGRGVDRHLLGLRMMQSTGDMAPIFKDPAYLKSMNFRLSTSNVSPGEYFYGGFGPVTADGYGINYAIGKDKLKFAIASRRQSKETCSRSFRKMLDETLRDLLKFTSS